MPRWYKGFQCSGIKPEVLIAQIKDLVRLHNLGMFVPVVRCEKQGSKQGFYFFLAIESAQIGDIPEEVRNALFQLSWLVHPVYDFTLDQIRSMTGAEYDVHSTHSIPYRRHVLPPATNPFEHQHRDYATDSVPHRDIIAQTQHFDHLLLWLSAVGHGSWSVFQNTWRQLNSSGNPQAHQVLRRLRLLGHIETSCDRQHWSSAPTVLTTIHAGERTGQFVLCGRRDAALLQTLRRVATVEILPQIQGDGPSTIYLYTTKPDRLAAILQERDKPVYWAGQAGLNLARHLPPLHEWKMSLEALPGVRPHAFTVKRFDDNGFTETNFTGASGFYELWPLEGNRRAAIKPEYTLFYDAANDRWLRADWYGLRFLAHYEAENYCPIRYAPETGTLAVPYNWRWPEIYERALVLASGRLPIQRGGWLIYDAIDTELLDELCDKLRLIQEEPHYA